MLILEVETATPRGSVSLVDEKGVILEHDSSGAATHATWLLPAIRDLLEKAGISLEEVDGFAVSAGPGSFTGLRIGLSTIKGLCLATGKPVVAVPTLDAMAELAGSRQQLICPLLDARKKEVYAALYRHLPGEKIRRESRYLVMAPRALAEEIGEAVFFLGNGVDLYRDLLAELLEEKATFSSAELRHPRASLVGRIGLNLLQRGQSAHYDELEPLYVRPSEAELKKQGR